MPEDDRLRRVIKDVRALESQLSDAFTDVLSFRAELPDGKRCSFLSRKRAAEMLAEFDMRTIGSEGDNRKLVDVLLACRAVVEELTKLNIDALGEERSR